MVLLNLLAVIEAVGVDVSLLSQPVQGQPVSSTGFLSVPHPHGTICRKKRIEARKDLLMSHLRYMQKLHNRLLGHTPVDVRITYELLNFQITCEMIKESGRIGLAVDEQRGKCLKPVEPVAEAGDGRPL